MFFSISCINVELPPIFCTCDIFLYSSFPLSLFQHLLYLNPVTMSQPLNFSQEKNASSPSKDEKSLSVMYFSGAGQDADSKGEGESWPYPYFAAGEAVMPGPAPTHLPPIRLQNLPRFLTKCNIVSDKTAKTFSRMKALKAQERNSKGPPPPFPSNASCQHLGPFSSDELLTFQGKRYIFCTSCARSPVIIEASNVSDFPTCRRNLFLKGVLLDSDTWMLLLLFLPINVSICTFSVLVFACSCFMIDALFVQRKNTYFDFSIFHNRFWKYLSFSVNMNLFCSFANFCPMATITGV